MICLLDADSDGHGKLAWWTFGTVLAMGYFGLVYWTLRGKVEADMY